MGEPRASRTAVLVCQGRAVAHGRLAVGRFDDPTAWELLRGPERSPVAHARSGASGGGWSARVDVELLGRQAEAMAVRTVAVDDAVRAAAHPQLVIVGAGLDGRAWRMPELSGVDVFEVDHPASQQDKQERAAALHRVAGSLSFVPIDLTQGDLGAELGAVGHQAARPTTWVLEGVIPYLTVEDAASVVASIAASSAPMSQLIVTYQTASSRAAAGRLLARGLLALMGRGDPMADEPQRSSWGEASIRALLSGAGLEVSADLDLPSLAPELSVSTRHLGSSRVAIAARVT